MTSHLIMSNEHASSAVIGVLLHYWYLGGFPHFEADERALIPMLFRPYKPAPDRDPGTLRRIALVEGLALFPFLIKLL